MPIFSTARRYRPQRFAEVVGQDHITIALRNLLVRNQIPQSLLFCGPHGVGKTTCARLLAKALNCLNLTPEGEPCNQCQACKEFLSGKATSVFELDAASNNSVDDIRNLIEHVRYPPTRQFKVYIIDEVHMLSQAAFNAFLKTLEEPPPYAVFVLATTEKYRILPTVLSRCQIYDFRRIPIPQIVQHLLSIAQQENIQLEQRAAYVIASQSDGSLRDALTLFDRLASYTTNQTITYTTVAQILHLLDDDQLFTLSQKIFLSDTAEILTTLRNLFLQGYEPAEILRSLRRHLRLLLHAHLNPNSLKEDLPPETASRYASFAQAIEPALLLSALTLLHKYESQLRYAEDKQSILEIALLEMTVLPWLNRARTIPTTTLKTTSQPQTTSNNTPTQTKTSQKPKTTRTTKKTSTTTQPAPQRTTPPPNPQKKPTTTSANKPQKDPFQTFRELLQLQSVTGNHH